MKFWTVAVFDLINIIIGLDHDVGTTINLKKKKKPMLGTVASPLFVWFDSVSHLNRCENSSHFLCTTFTSFSQIIFTLDVFSHKHDACETVSYEGHLRM